jgi:hypothetical protein
MLVLTEGTAIQLVEKSAHLVVVHDGTCQVDITFQLLNLLTVHGSSLGRVICYSSVSGDEFLASGVK